MSVRLRSLESFTSKKTGDLLSMPLMDKPVSEYFNEFVFGPEAKKKYLPIEILEKLTYFIDNSLPIDRETADFIAIGLKNWAIDHQVTHYTHWFQPLTGKTSEKHDTFFQFDKNWRAIEKMSGNELIMQEPDGSSFPTGGMRSTHEARSYTVWDPTTPIFIRRTKFGRTLCIPAFLISYTGESLDMKAPLLKSMRLINQEALKICKIFDEKISKVTPTLGWEQEYFVVDEALFNARPDLVLCGRTLYGNASARGQQLADHYFGAIPERVYNFIIEFEQEALRLGIPIKTRHNEVAPNQFECAPHFEFANIAADHNLLLMDKIDKVAKRHGLRVLINEKPFQGINGSGKHNNWSLATDTGKNLLEPGDEPHNNLMFLTFFINTLVAVYNHSDLLRASIASAGNDHRLGANEAPPAIISASIGSQMENALEAFLNDSEPESEKPIEGLNLDYLMVPFKKMHTTDRNRTSPFPFTGNKFEFRAPGSSVNVSLPMTTLNVIVAAQLNSFLNQVDAEVEKLKDGAKIINDLKKSIISKLLKEVYLSCQPILFNGDNYSHEWVEEAELRGLPNLKSTPQALSVYLKKENIELFEKFGIYSQRELVARYNVFIEEYLHKIEIEAVLVDEIAYTMIIPAVVNYQNDLIKNVQGLKELGLLNESEAYKNQLLKISTHLEGMISNLEQLDDNRREASSISNLQEKAEHYSSKIKPLFDLIRHHADKLEMIVDDKFWQLPKYRELLFLH
ncbi:MAG: glutamine synthetase III [Candidatus Kapabacteria bacterium]|nr:glutamine synthetase III [Ignavibacteriota bacterium]MCW5884375.1 glutamine synthetase III [Candidatus Kapabacteria bacterium]